MLTPAIHNRLISWVSQESNLQRIAHYLNIGLIILLAASAAHLTWQLIPEPDLAEKSVINPSSFNFSTPAQTTNPVLQKVSSFHLFGLAEQQRSKPVERPTIQRDAKPTKLNLSLKGVLFTAQQSSALAIIADAKKEEKHYRVGDSLPMGAELVEIHADRIILSYRGQFESLQLESEIGGSPRYSSPSQNSVATRIDSRSNPELAGLLTDYRTALMQDPASLADLIQITPATNGTQFTGFTLNPGRDPELFQRFGFRAGDVVTAVNGVSLDDPMRGMEVFNSLSTSSSLDVTVNRNGQEVSLSFEVGQ